MPRDFGDSLPCRQRRYPEDLSDFPWSANEPKNPARFPSRSLSHACPPPRFSALVARRVWLAAQFQPDSRWVPSFRSSRSGAFQFVGLAVRASPTSALRGVRLDPRLGRYFCWWIRRLLLPAVALKSAYSFPALGSR